MSDSSGGIHVIRQTLQLTYFDVMGKDSKAIQRKIQSISGRPDFVIDPHLGRSICSPRMAFARALDIAPTARNASVERATPIVRLRRKMAAMEKTELGSSAALGG